MKTKGRRSYRPSSVTHRVARGFAASLGRRIVKIEAKHRIPLPVIDQDAAVLWHVVTTAPHAEKRAYAWLQDTYPDALLHWPTQVRWAKHAREQKAVERSLFPGYLFVAMPIDAVLANSDRERSGIVDVCRLSPRGSQRLARLLASIVARQFLGEFDEPGTTERRGDTGPLPYSIGEVVEIMQGAFALVLGRVVEAETDELAVETSFMGRATKIRVPVASVRPIVATAR